MPSTRLAVDGGGDLLQRVARFHDVSRRRSPVQTKLADLAVEVLSEGNTRGEMERKLRDYFNAGVRLVWYLDPKTRTLQAYTSPEESVLIREEDSLDGGDPEGD